MSPVKTHTFIPASFKYYIVGPTSSYNLSSIAVPPINSNSYSISLYASIILSSLFYIAVQAKLYFFSHSLYTYNGNILFVNNNVLKPIDANSYKSLHVLFINYGTIGFILGSIIESAPFV